MKSTAIRRGSRITSSLSSLSLNPENVTVSEYWKLQLPKIESYSFPVLRQRQLFLGNGRHQIAFSCHSLTSSEVDDDVAEKNCVRDDVEDDPAVRRSGRDESLGRTCWWRGHRWRRRWRRGGWWGWQWAAGACRCPNKILERERDVEARDKILKRNGGNRDGSQERRKLWTMQSHSIPSWLRAASMSIM